VVATLVMAGYSIFLLDFTYLEPLPWRSGQIGVVLLLVAALGAGMLGGGRWWSYPLLLAACGIGVYYPSGSLQHDGRWWSDWFNADTGGSVDDPVLYLLLLAPVAIVLGALVGRRTGNRTAGALVLAVPLAVIVWAGIRHANPIDHRPAHPSLIVYPSYRGVSIGQRLPRVMSVLGKPDRGSLADGDFAYGHDLFEFSAGVDDPEPANYRLGFVEIRNPDAQTREGVGIGDSLSLAKSRLDANCDYYKDFEPKCNALYDSEGFQRIEFYGDPIEWIRID
jgi:hypothetical protein